MGIEEEWRPVVGYEGLYEVSTTGRVRNVGSGRGRRPGVLLTAWVSKQGYPSYKLYRGGHGVTFKASVLVALAHIGPRPKDYDICHNNGDKSDNRVENLRFDTRSENTLDVVRHGQHHLASKTHCKRGHALNEENVYLNTGGGYTSRQCRKCQREASRRYQIKKKERKNGFH